MSTRACTLAATIAALLACAPPARAPDGERPDEDGPGGGGGGGPVARSPLRRGAFQTLLRLDELDGGGPELGMEYALGVAFAQLAPGRWQLVLSGAEDVTVDDAASVVDGELAATPGTAVAMYGGSCDGVVVEFEELVLRVEDPDGDSVADTLGGRASGRISRVQGDEIFTGTFAGQVVATRDTAPPAVVETSAGLLPLDPLRLRFGEPVRAAPFATVQVQGVPRPATVTPAGVPTTRLTVHPLEPLPWGAVPEARLGIVDLAGLGDEQPYTVSASVREGPAGTFVPSFEAGSFDGLAVDGDVRLYDSSIGLPADEGARFLVAAALPSWRIVVELDVPATGEPLLVLVGRLLASPGAIDRTAGPIRVVARAGTDRVEAELLLPASGRELSSPVPIATPIQGGITWVSDPQLLQVFLGPLRGRRAVVEISYESDALLACGPPMPDADGWLAIMLDGLAVASAP